MLSRGTTGAYSINDRRSVERFQAVFHYTEENLQELEKCFSAPRLERYRLMANGDLAKAFEYYAWNIALSEAILGPIQGLEVILRNQIHACLSKHFGLEWYDSLPLIWMVPQLSQIEKAKQQLFQAKGAFSASQLIAELSLGFWIGILSRHYEMNLWRPYLHACFTYLPKPFKRKDVFKALGVIREVRNRVAHHEPILSRELDQDYQLLLQIVAWMSPQGAEWIDSHSRFTQIIQAKPY